jgi:hypothetical protein
MAAGVDWTLLNTVNDRVALEENAITTTAGGRTTAAAAAGDTVGPI